MRCDIDSGYLLASEPFSVDGGPVLLLHLDMGQLGKFWGDSIIDGARQAEDAVIGIAGFERSTEMTEDALASVAGGADDQDSTSDDEYSEMIVAGAHMQAVGLACS